VSDTPLGGHQRARATLEAHVAALLESGVTERRTKELVGVMVAWLNACEY